MAASRFKDHILGIGTLGARPSAATSPEGALYSASDTGIIYKVVAGAWVTWATLGAVGGAANSILIPGPPGEDGEPGPQGPPGLDGAAGGGGGGAPTTVPYFTAAADATLSAEIVVPGAALLNERATQGALFDGFDTTDTSDPMTGWTTLGTPTAHDMNSTVRSHYYHKKTGTSGTVGLTGIYKTWSPSAGKFVECALSEYQTGKNAASNYAGIMIGEAGGTGKITALFIGRYGANFDDRVVCYQYTTRTAFGSEVYSGVAGSPFHPPIGLRFLYNSSTSVDIFFTYTGRLPRWVANFNPGYTIAIAGLALDASGGSTDVEAIFDWFNDG